MTEWTKVVSGPHNDQAVRTVATMRSQFIGEVHLENPLYEVRSTGTEAQSPILRGSSLEIHFSNFHWEWPPIFGLGSRRSARVGLVHPAPQSDFGFGFISSSIDSNQDLEPGRELHVLCRIVGSDARGYTVSFVQEWGHWPIIPMVEPRQVSKGYDGLPRGDYI